MYAKVSMATAETADGAGGTDEVACARDFVENRLQEAESPVTPSGMATEYGCSNGHVRNILADLLNEGAAERVGRGQYVAAGDAPDDEVADVVTDFDPDNSGVLKATTSTEDTDAEADPSADGGPPSEDRDTEDGDGLDDDETDDEGTEEGVGGIPIPVSTTTLAVGVVLALVVVWWMTRDSGESDQQNQQDEQDEGFADDLEDVTGGLVG
jgi:hypothetical protein